MPVQVSYKKQFALMFMLLITFLVVIEIIVNIWLYYFYRCDFEDNEVFKDTDPEINRQVCLSNIGIEYEKKNWLHLVKGTNSPRSQDWDENFIYINSHGLRNTEFTKEKPENTYRIFTIGGSTTFGTGVQDKDTISFFLQEMYDKANLDFNVKVINAGWPNGFSETETNLIKNKLLGFEPDLFIVYDGWNDIRFEHLKDGSDFGGNVINTSPVLWKERWMEICDLGKLQSFDTIITLQPWLTTGKRILTLQEVENKIIMLNSDYISDLDYYPLYLEQLDELKNHCTLTGDLRSIFNHVEEPIFFDSIHTGPKGNQIIAENFYALSLPIVTKKVSSNFMIDSETGASEKLVSISVSVDDNQPFDAVYYTLKDIILLYKTPSTFSLIFDQ